MPNIKSQIKRMRQAKVRRLRNKAVKSEIKTLISKFEEAISQGDLEKAKENLKETIRHLDKAVSKGVIHKNRAADKKSKLMKRFNALESKIAVQSTSKTSSSKTKES